jgi:tetratricopeptide (TPR) repeat protein
MQILRFYTLAFLVALTLATTPGCAAQNANERDSAGTNINEATTMTDGQRPTTDDLQSILDEWEFGDPAASEARFRELLEAHPDATQGWKFLVRTQVARALGLQREFDEAHAELDAIEQGLDADGLPRVYHELERGRVLNSSGKPGEAKPHFERAWESARRLGHDAAAVDAAHMLAIVTEGESALAWNEKALALAESSDDPAANKWKGSLLNNLGWTHHDNGDFEKALDMFERALEFRQEQSEPERTRIAKWSVARTLRSLGRVEEALAMQRAIAQDYPQTDDPYVDLEIGECLVELGREDEATPHFEAAWAALKDDNWYREQNPQKYQRLRELAGADE